MYDGQKDPDNRFKREPSDRDRISCDIGHLVMKYQNKKTCKTETELVFGTASLY